MEKNKTQPEKTHIPKTDTLTDSSKSSSYRNAFSMYLAMASTVGLLTIALIGNGELNSTNISATLLVTEAEKTSLLPVIVAIISIGTIGGIMLWRKKIFNKHNKTKI
jgi:hypothetical protein